MSRILGPAGKPATPDLLPYLNWPGWARMVERDLERESQFSLMLKLAELRKSCGVEPEPRTLVFRRYPDIKK